MATAAQHWCVQEVALGMIGLIAQTSDATLALERRAVRETYNMAAHALRSRGRA